MSYTSELAAYVADTSYERLPPAAVGAAKRVTLDLLGVAVAAAATDPGRIASDYALSLGGCEQATVLGRPGRTNTVNAALANGVLAAELEQDDVHATGTHPSSVYVPALLAVAEYVDASGTDWINALVAAYDVGIRVNVATDTVQLFARGFHPTSICGSIGAAAGVARLLGLDAERTGYAIGLAGCQAAGLMTWTAEPRHFSKSFQSGMAARNAVVAAELAARGYEAAPDTLDGDEYNVFDSFSTRRDFPPLTAELGERYDIVNTTYKMYACCLAIHTTLDILFDLIREHSFGSDDVEKMSVWLPPELRPIVDKRVTPTHNLQFVAAAAMTDGVVTREQSSGKRHADPALADIASRIALSDDPDLMGRHPGMSLRGPTRVDLLLKDGRRFVVERGCARGNSANPVSDAHLQDKFLHFASPVISPDRADEVVSRVRHLTTVKSIREITELFSVSSV